MKCETRPNPRRLVEVGGTDIFCNWRLHPYILVSSAYLQSCRTKTLWGKLDSIGCFLLITHFSTSCQKEKDTLRCCHKGNVSSQKERMGGDDWRTEARQKRTGRRAKQKHAIPTPLATAVVSTAIKEGIIWSFFGSYIWGCWWDIVNTGW